MVKLTVEQEIKFDTLLDIINNELKSLVFLSIGDDYSTSTQICLGVNGTFDLEKDLIPRDVYSYLKKVLASEERDLLDHRKAKGINKRIASHWRKSQLGNELTPLVRYAMQFLPLKGHDSPYNISASEVIGAMNSAFYNRASHSRVAVLLDLAENERSTNHLAGLTGLTPTNMEKKLAKLEQVTNVYGEIIPFVESSQISTKQGSHTIVEYTGKPLDKDDFTFRPERMLHLLSMLSNSNDAFEYTTDIFGPSQYDHLANLHKALKKLEEKGYVKLSLTNEFREYKIAEAGKFYVNECLIPVRLVLSGDHEAVRHIKKNQPTISELSECGNIYIKNKNRRTD